MSNILVYARSRTALAGTIWRAPKDGVLEIGAEYHRLRKIHGDDYQTISQGLATFYKKLPKEHPARKYSRAKNADRRGVWRDNNITWPGGGGPKYDVIHPGTGKPCKVPDDGWRFIESTMLQKIADDWVVFREDHTKPPFLKSYIYMVEDSSVDEELNEGKKEVLGSVFYRHSQPSLDVMRGIFGEKVFPNPKDHEVVARLIRYVTGDDRHCLILDSFAGSGTTGHAVLTLNAQDGGDRRFVLCELDANIARTITAERLKRVIDGYGDIPGLGGTFRYCRLGEPLFDAEGHLRDDVKWGDLAHHLWFAESGEPWMPQFARAQQSLTTGGPMIGVAPDGRAVYLLFSTVGPESHRNGASILSAETLASLAPFSGPRVVYADACTLRPTALSRERIAFKQIPYQVQQQ